MVRLKYEDEAEVRSRVLSLLPEGEKVRWIEIVRKVRNLRSMSLSTVRKYLERAMKDGVVERIVDTESRPPAVYYRRIPSPSMRSSKNMSAGDLLRLCCLSISESFLGNLKVYITNEEFRKHLDKFCVYGGLISFVLRHGDVYRYVEKGWISAEAVLSEIPKLQSEIRKEIESILEKYDTKPAVKGFK